MKLSIVIPCYNERCNIDKLVPEITAVLDQNDLDGEIIIVDDGSTDGSMDVIASLAQQDLRVKALELRRNFGQTAALVAGMDHATGDVIIPMDADLQNDPADIPHLLTKMAEGYDVVSGWRKERKDKALSRRLPSVIANRLISKISGVHLHDYGCTLKAYKKSVIEQVKLYGEMHRFIPIYAHWQGGQVAELPVNHRSRVWGQSKYGLNRTFKVILDLVTIKFLGSYSTKPIYLFGSVGLSLFFLGMFTGMGGIIHRFFSGPWAHRVPLLLFAVFCCLAGMQLVLIGLLAEIMIRTYHESQDKTIYLVRNRYNMGTPGASAPKVTIPSATASATAPSAAPEIGVGAFAAADSTQKSTRNRTCVE